jgi:hypothetical protein
MRFHAVRSHHDGTGDTPYRGGHQGSALQQVRQAVAQPGRLASRLGRQAWRSASTALTANPSRKTWRPNWTSSSSRHPVTRAGALDQSDEDDTHRCIRALMAKYSTPEIMRHNADLFSAAQPGPAELVRMMRRIADDKSTQFMTCEKPGTHHGGTVHQVGRSAYQTRIQSMSMAAGKLPREGSPPPGPPTARVNIGDSQ